MFNPWRPLVVRRVAATIAVAAAQAFAPACAAEPSGVSAPVVDFVRDVRPIFAQHCYSCHGPVKQKSGLRLDIRTVALAGGEAYAPNIVPGKAADSPLVRFVRGDDPDLLMPPDGPRLSAAEVAVLTNWVNQGAVWPEGVDLARLDDKRDHWSFKPLKVVAPPRVANEAWPRNAIDRFILARLEAVGIRPAPEADAVTLARRLSLDLTGLPPSPEEVVELKSSKPSTSLTGPTAKLSAWDDAYSTLVDRLLASPRYGERWAQHWLDVVRYADTHGFEVNTPRPNAWPYRDYVIRAFNDDLPYDRFIREQIVGDALGSDAATGFLVTASVLLPGQIGKDEPSIRLARQDALDEIVVNAGQTFLGLSIGCARCHDHKFDPVSQAEYYSMQAFFAGVEYADRDLQTPEADAARRQVKELRSQVAAIERKLLGFQPLANSGALRSPVNSRINVERFAPRRAKFVRLTIFATNNLEPCIDELEVFDATGRNVALAGEGATVVASGETVVADRHELRQIIDGKYGNARSWLSNEPGGGWVEIELAEPTLIERVVWGRDREGKYTDRLAVDYRIELALEPNQWLAVADSHDRKQYSRAEKKPAEFSLDGLNEPDTQQARQLLAEKSSLEARTARLNELTQVFAGKFRTPDAIRRLHRGDPEQPKELVPPAVPEVLGKLQLTADLPEQQRRRELAEWLALPTNPLTARVMVNRIWQGHFGAGLVDTPSDFGRNGARPSHPELLDWLAAEFIRSGWSIKHMHRLIVQSATYRQSAQIDASAQSQDADNRLLWRFPARRLEGEAIRDSMLSVSGRLDLKMGGPGFDLFTRRGGLTGFPPIESFSGDGLRRMIYAHKIRRERDAVFGPFDCPDAGQSTARRGSSTTPIQALNLFNSQFTIDQSAAFAERAIREVGDQPKAQIRRAYQLALARQPAEDEIDAALPAVREFGLSALCRALFNSNEFLFLP